jgi:hypothetical protein
MKVSRSASGRKIGNMKKGSAVLPAATHGYSEVVETHVGENSQLIRQFIINILIK